MTAQGKFEVAGTVKACHKGALFRVQIDGSDHTVLARPSGKMIRSKISITIEDRVRVEMDGYDLSRGRITFRYRD